MADKWHVTGQSLQTELNPNGSGFVTVWQVKYIVDSGPAAGTQGQISVPSAQHNADTVKALIDQAVYNLDQVAGL